LFGVTVTSTTEAVAATVLGTHYLLVCGPAYNVGKAAESAPDDWHETWAESREGADAGAGTWLPDWSVAAYLLGKL
jgi:hypothetical protein